MNQYFQKALGMFNRQSMTIIEQRKVIEFVPKEIEDILDTITNSKSPTYDQDELTPPNLEEKNKLNSVTVEYNDLIEVDFIHFDGIDCIIKQDKSLQNKYEISKRILQQQFLSDFSGDFPAFTNAWMTKLGISKSSNESIKAVILLHYMYSECEIGIKPR